MPRRSSTTRQEIFQAALKQFAENGYAGTSMQSIADCTRFTKPALYYHFKNKEGLFQSLLDTAYDECFELMRKAASKSSDLEDQLIDIIASVFTYLKAHPELIHLAFFTAFAAPREAPENLSQREKRERNFEFFHQLMLKAQRCGRVSRRFTSLELAHGVFGALSWQLMASILMPKIPLNRQTARQMTKLFLQGAEMHS